MARMADFDLAVIGAGTAGLAVAAAAGQFGASVALIERGAMGGHALNTGCIPAQALLAASRALRRVRDAARYGISAADSSHEPSPNWDGVRAHVQAVIAAIAPTASEPRLRALGATVLRGEARFIDNATIAVEGRTVTARRFVIAAGSRPAPPPIEGLHRAQYWTSDSLFELATQPNHLLILGGGPMGLEMADAFSGLGCKVTVTDSGRIAAQEDPELTFGLRLALSARGVTFREGIAATGVAPGPELLLADGTRIQASHLLVATGRTPNLAALNLPAAGILAGPAGIATDRGLRSVSNRRVFAVGSIVDPAGIGPRTGAHIGSHHAGTVIRRALFRLPARSDDAVVSRVTFTDPELAQTGMTEAEASAAGLNPRVLRWPLADNDRAIAERDTTGLVKLIVSGNRVVGAGILAPHAGEMISQWSLAIARRTKLSELAALIVPSPTRSEAAKRAAGSAFAAALFSARTKRLVGLLSRLP